jgi:hypothetical protein
MWEKIDTTVILAAIAYTCLLLLCSCAMFDENLDSPAQRPNTNRIFTQYVGCRLNRGYPEEICGKYINEAQVRRFEYVLRTKYIPKREAMTNVELH